MFDWRVNPLMFFFSQRGQFAAADLLQQQLSATEHTEPDCALEIAVIKVDLLMRTGNYVSVRYRKFFFLLQEIMR